MIGSEERERSGIKESEEEQVEARSTLLLLFQLTLLL
jgi:hypothetical protein